MRSQRHSAFCFHTLLYLLKGTFGLVVHDGAAILLAQLDEGTIELASLPVAAIELAQSDGCTIPLISPSTVRYTLSEH